MIEDIEKSKMYEFVGTSCQTTVSEVLKIVRAISCSRSPIWPSTNTGFFATVRDRIAAFRRVPPPESDTGLKAKLGKEAIQAKLAEAQTKKTDTPLSYQDIASFRI